MTEDMRDKSNDVIGNPSKEIPEYYSGSKSRKILCHPMISSTKHAGKPIKVKAWEQEFRWRKRIYPIEQTRVITDEKGIGHLYFNVNDSSIYAFDLDHTSKCVKCGGKMSVDARNIRDLTKRKVIQNLWGVDSLPMLLLIIMGIIIMVMVIAVFYIYQDNVKTHTQLERFLLPPPTATVTNK